MKKPNSLSGCNTSAELAPGRGSVAPSPGAPRSRSRPIAPFEARGPTSTFESLLVAFEPGQELGSCRDALGQLLQAALAKLAKKLAAVVKEVARPRARRTAPNQWCQPLGARLGRCFNYREETRESPQIWAYINFVFEGQFDER